jgi:hypothetical protein
MPSGLPFAFEVGSSDLSLIDLLTEDLQGKYIWTLVELCSATCSRATSRNGELFGFSGLS